MSMFFVYFLLMLTNIVNFFMVVTLGSATCAGVGGLIYWAERDLESGTRDFLGKWCKRLFVIALVFGFAVSFIPNTKQAVTIWLAPKVVNNEQIQEVPQKGLNILVEHMDQYLEDLQDEKGE